jgi:hypothetical protein
MRYRNRTFILSPYISRTSRDTNVKIADLNEQIRKLKITNQMLFRADERPSNMERGARIADYNAYAEHIVGERQKGEQLSRQLQSEKIVSQGLRDELSVLKGIAILAILASLVRLTREDTLSDVKEVEHNKHVFGEWDEE